MISVKQLLTYLAIGVAVILALHFGAALLHIAVVAAVIAAVVYFVTPIRTVVFNWLGFTQSPLTLTDIIGDLEKKVEDLVTHAKDLIAEAEGHKQAALAAQASAEKASATASRADAIAKNLSSLIAQ